VAFPPKRATVPFAWIGPPSPMAGVIDFPPYRLDPRSGRVWHGDRLVELRPKAWALLHYLAERPGVLVTKEELHAAARGDVVVSDDTLTQTLGELRRALQDDPRAPRVVETVHRRGVPFVARVTAASRAGQRSVPGVPSGTRHSGSRRALVGRDTELSTLWALFNKAAAGERQVVFIAGEPGIGKTSLVEGFLNSMRASSDAIFIGYGQCLEQYGEREPYMPAVEAVERMGHGPGRDRLLRILPPLPRTGWPRSRRSTRPSTETGCGAGTPTRRLIGRCVSSRTWWNRPWRGLRWPRSWARQGHPVANKDSLRVGRHRGGMRPWSYAARHVRW
jgi:DNA-binding winged helix-turn-helix (wHTH) protein